MVAIRVLGFFARWICLISRAIHPVLLRVRGVSDFSLDCRPAATTARSPLRASSFGFPSAALGLAQSISGVQSMDSPSPVDIGGLFSLTVLCIFSIFQFIFHSICCEEVPLICSVPLLLYTMDLFLFFYMNS